MLPLMKVTQGWSRRCSMFSRLPGGEVVDDDDVVILSQGVGKVRADEAGPAGDDVAHEEIMALSAGLGLSELCRHEGNPIGAWQEDDIS
jgi:hypothetical protein